MGEKFVHTKQNAMKVTSVYAINEIQNVFDGRGTVNVPHKNTINGIGNASKLCE